MNENNDYKILELDHPHGFLIWRGKQTALGTPESLPVGEKLLIVSEGEAFGYVTLKAPAQMKSSEFDREEYQKEHRLYPTEWRLDWPDVKMLNLYRFESWEPFEKAMPFENGKILTDEPTPHEAALIDKSRYLPKTLVLDDEAITMTGGKFTIAAGLTVPDDLKQILQTTYETEVEFVGQKQAKYLPLYRLALVRVPNMRIKKKGTEASRPDSGVKVMSDGKVEGQQDAPAVAASTKQEMDMPWEKVRDHMDCPSDKPVAVVKTGTGEVEGCHANEEEANAQLAALSASEAGESGKDSGEKQESLQQKVDRIRQQFSDAFPPEDDGDCCYHDLWVNDIFDSFVIANDSGNLYRVSYMDMGESVVFAPRNDWVEVEIGYNPKGFTLLARNDPRQKEKERNWKDRLREAAKTVMDFVQGADSGFQKGEMTLDEDTEKMFNTESGFMVRTIDGDPWHFTWSTNAFEDRDGEIFATKALERFVAENEVKKQKGFFNFWHIEGTDFAEKQWQAVIGRFLVEAGPYLNNEAGRRAKEYFSKFSEGDPYIAPEGWGSSPEFVFLPEERAKDGVYYWLWITRTSTLRRAAAANIYTEGSQIMAMTKQQEQAAVRIFGEEFVNRLKADGEKRTQKLEMDGIAYKGKKADKTELLEEDSEKSPEESEEVTQTAQVEDEPEEADTATEEEAEESESDEGGEAVPVVEVNVEELAAEVKKQFEFDLQPVADAMAEILKEIKAVGDRVTKLEKQESVKQQVETPRFLLNLVRASQAEETAVADGDDLKGQKPKETKPNKGGTLMGNFFPGPK